jgi:hypothetical protein
MKAGGLVGRRQIGDGAGAGRRLRPFGLEAAGSGLSPAARTGASTDGVKDAGDGVGGEDRCDRLEVSQATVRAGAHIGARIIVVGICVEPDGIDPFFGSVK